MLKIRNDSDRKLIEQLILKEGLLHPEEDKGVQSFIKRRKSIVDKLNPFGRDSRKSLNAKRNWVLNRKKLERGIKQFHNSTAGKTFHRKLNRFNCDRLGGYGRVFSESFTKEEFLTALLSLQTHLIIESQFIIPDLETHLSTALMIELAMDILEDVTKKVRINEILDEVELAVIKDLTL